MCRYEDVRELLDHFRSIALDLRTIALKRAKRYAKLLTQKMLVHDMLLQTVVGPPNSWTVLLHFLEAQRKHGPSTNAALAFHCALNTHKYVFVWCQACCQKKLLAIATPTWFWSEMEKQCLKRATVCKPKTRSGMKCTLTKGLVVGWGLERVICYSQVLVQDGQSDRPKFQD